MRPVPAAAATVGPTTYVIPKIHGDPAAAYRLADAYRDLADAVVTSQQRSTHIIANLDGGWRGRGHQGLNAPVDTLTRDATALVRRLRDTADMLDAYGRHLEKAHHHHGFSLHRLLVVGAVVAVSVVAVTVTLGAAGLVEAAAAAAAVGTATEAAAAATAADLAAAGGIDAAFASGVSIRPLLAFVLPHLMQAEWAGGAVAGWDEASTGRVRWHRVAETGAFAFIASGGADGATSMARDSDWLARAPERVQAAVPHVVEGTAWAGAAASDDLVVNHRLDLLDVSEAFVLAGGSTMARDALRERGLWWAEPDYRRMALVNLAHQRGVIVDPAIANELAMLRQSPIEIRRGEIDLRLQEGPGHTIDRHIGKSAHELLARVRTGRIPVASTYWDETVAHDATRLTLSANAARIDRWVAAGSPTNLRLRLTVPFNIGFAIDTSGKVTFVRETTVVLRRDGAGIVLLTSFPRGRR
jgi:hypothetical protein